VPAAAAVWLIGWSKLTGDNVPVLVLKNGAFHSYDYCNTLLIGIRTLKVETSSQRRTMVQRSGQEVFQTEKFTSSISRTRDRAMATTERE